MKRIFAVVLLLLPVSAFTQQSTLNLTFSPESEKLERAAQFKELREFTEKGAAMNPNLNASESQVNAGNTTLYTRVAGNGQPIIILHGGPISTIAISFPTLTD